MEFAKRFLIGICLVSCVFFAGCKTFQASNASACNVGFDYKDPGVNDTNARALLVHYCLCVDDKLCK